MVVCTGILGTCCVLLRFQNLPVHVSVIYHSNENQPTMINFVLVFCTDTFWNVRSGTVILEYVYIYFVPATVPCNCIQ